MLHTFGFNFFRGTFLFLQVVYILHGLRAVERSARITAENIGRDNPLFVHRVVVLRNFDYLFLLLFRLVHKKFSFLCVCVFSFPRGRADIP